MSPTSRPRPTRPGPVRGCPPRSSGRKPAPGIRRATPGAATRGETPNRRTTVANLGGTALRPAPVGAYPAGASAYGAEQMLGDVWEWTSSPLRPVARLRADDLRALLASRSSTATTGCCGADRGRWSRHSAAQLPQLGSSVSAGRSSPVSGWPGMPGRRDPA